MVNNPNSRLIYLDICRFTAILAVCCDHLYDKIYDNYYLHQLTYFSVALFVFVAGITARISFERHKDTPVAAYLLKRVKSVFLPYAVAVLIYSLRDYKSEFTFKTYLLELFSFDISDPLYFVLFFLQLTLVAPLLIRLLDRCERAKHPLLCKAFYVLAVALISLAVMRFEVFPKVYVGAKYLFGGSYLFVYFCGLLLARRLVSPPLHIPKAALTAILPLCASVGATILWANLPNEVTEAYPILFNINPPGLLLIINAFSMALFIRWFIEILPKTKLFKAFLHIGGAVGKSSLYIFLYHMLVLQALQNNWGLTLLEKQIIYLPSLILLPCVLYYIVEETKQLLRENLSSEKASDSCD